MKTDHSHFLQKLFIAFCLLLLSACGGGGSGGGSSSSDNNSGGGGSNPTNNNTASKSFTPASLVSVDAFSGNSLTIAWLPAQSDGVATYQVHISTDENFTPSTQTLKVTTQQYSVVISSGITTATKYYVRILSVLGADSKSSLQLSITTPELISQISSQTVIVKTTNQKVSTNQVVVSNTSSTPKVGEYIIIHDGETTQVRKVKSISTNSSATQSLQTEPVRLSDMFETVEFSSVIKFQDVPQAVSKSISSKAKGHFSGKGVTTRKVISPAAPHIHLEKTPLNTLKSQFNWNSGLSLSAENFLQPKFQSKAIIESEAYNVGENDYQRYRIPKTIILNIGDTLNKAIIPTAILKKVLTESASFFGSVEKDRALCEMKGGSYDEIIRGIDYCRDMPLSICDISLTSEHKELSDSNLPIIKKEGEKYTLYWQPQAHNIDFKKGKPYETEITIKVGVACGTKYENSREINLQTDLYAGDELGSDIVTNNAVTFDDAANGVSLSLNTSSSFKPELQFDVQMQKKSLKHGKATVEMTYTLEQLYHYLAQGQVDHTFTPKPLFAKSFTKVFTIGFVPVVVRGDFRLMATVNVSAKGKIEAMLQNNNRLTLRFGMEYKEDDGEGWRPTGGSEFTYTISAGGKANTEATVTVTLIPDFNIRFYELAASHLLVEPYLYGTVGLQGTINAQLSNQTNSFADANNRFTKLLAGIGVDSRLYAGAAWDTSLKFLKWPNDATFAQIGNASFMNSKLSKYLKEYYENTRTYKKIEILGKKIVAGLPTLGISSTPTDKLPVEINHSRAVKVSGHFINQKNETGIGKDYLIKFDRWREIEKISKNFEILNTTHPANPLEPTHYWLVPRIEPNGATYDIQTRLVGQSNLAWARQTIETTLKTAAEPNKLPSYWKTRYALTDESKDKDNDGFTNWQEYQSGTHPDDADSKPTLTAESALIFIQTYAIFDEANPALLQHYEILDIQGVNAENINAVNQAIQSLKASQVDSKEKVQAVVNQVLNTPANLNAVTGDQQITFSWQTANNASAYHLYYAQESLENIKTDLKKISNLQGGKKITLPANRTNYTIFSLTNGTEYHVILTSVFDAIESIPSGEITAIPAKILPPPSTPTGLQATIGDKQITLSWNAVANASTYTLIQDGTVQTHTTQTNHTITGLTNRQSYTFQLQAHNSVGSSGLSQSINATPLIPPPTGITLTAQSTNAINLVWNKVTNADYYEIYNNLSDTTTSASIIHSPLSAQTNYTHEGLQADTTYYYWLKSCQTSQSYCSDFSAMTSTKTLYAEASTTTMLKPQIIEVTASNQEITIGWSAVTSTSAYHLYQAQKTFGNLAVANYDTLSGYQKHPNITNTSQKITGLVWHPLLFCGDQP